MNKVLSFLNRNGSTILTCIGAIGVIATSVMAVKATPKAIKMIDDIVKEVEIGAVYTVKVVKIEDFGAFVELWPGCEGLVHVSQLDNKRVNHPSDILKVGDEIVVKATGYDRKGKLNLSRKELLPKLEKKDNKKEEVSE